MGIKLFYDIIHMNNLLRQINEKEDVQEKIISNSYELCYSLYSLFRHHGYSIEYLIKYIFHKGVNEKGILFLRENTYEHNILEDFYLDYCNNFDILSKKILKLANKKSTIKNISKQKRVDKIIKNAIKIFSKYLPKVFSDTLLDFCDHAKIVLSSECKSTNSSEEDILCSFIFLRIIFPNIISYVTKRQKAIENLASLIKTLNKMVNGHFKDQITIKKIIYDILSRKRNPNYQIIKTLSSKKYLAMGTILLDEINKNISDYEKHGIELLYLRVASVQIAHRLRLPKNDTTLRKSKSIGSIIRNKNSEDKSKMNPINVFKFRKANTKQKSKTHNDNNLKNDDSEDENKNPSAMMMNSDRNFTAEMSERSLDNPRIMVINSDRNSPARKSQNNPRSMVVDCDRNSQARKSPNNPRSMVMDSDRNSPARKLPNNPRTIITDSDRNSPSRKSPDNSRSIIMDRNSPAGKSPNNPRIVITDNDKNSLKEKSSNNRKNMAINININPQTNFDFLDKKNVTTVNNNEYSPKKILSNLEIIVNFNDKILDNISETTVRNEGPQNERASYRKSCLITVSNDHSPSSRE